MNMRCVVSPPGSISTADGSALVHSGDTVVLCGVKAVSLPPTITVTLSHHIFLFPSGASQPCSEQPLPGLSWRACTCLPLGWMACHIHSSVTVCNVELPPCCSAHISSGPPSSRAQALSQTLQDTLLRYTPTHTACRR